MDATKGQYFVYQYVLLKANLVFYSSTAEVGNELSYEEPLESD